MADSTRSGLGAGATIAESDSPGCGLAGASTTGGNALAVTVDGAAAAGRGLAGAAEITTGAAGAGLVGAAIVGVVTCGRGLVGATATGAAGTTGVGAPLATGALVGDFGISGTATFTLVICAGRTASGRGCDGGASLTRGRTRACSRISVIGWSGLAISTSGLASTIGITGRSGVTSGRVTNIGGGRTSARASGGASSARATCSTCAGCRMTGSGCGAITCRVLGTVGSIVRGGGVTGANSGCLGNKGCTTGCRAMGICDGICIAGSTFSIRTVSTFSGCTTSD